MDRSARSRTSRVLIALAFTGVLPMLAGCPEKKPVIVDAGAPPPPPTDTVTNLVPMDDTVDAGDPDADAAVKRGPSGPAVNPNIARLKQCCAALAAQAKAQGNSPELTTAAAQCSAAVANVGPAGTAPEFAVIRQMLVGKTIPAVCQGM